MGHWGCCASQQNHNKIFEKRGTSCRKIPHLCLSLKPIHFDPNVCKISSHHHMSYETYAYSTSKYNLLKINAANYHHDPQSWHEPVCAPNRPAAWTHGVPISRALPVHASSIPDQSCLSAVLFPSLSSTNCTSAGQR